MRIERFDPEADPARTLACYQAYRASVPVDDPPCPPASLRAFTGFLACGWTEDYPEAWAAGEAPGQADGYYTASLPMRENHHQSHIDPVVRPAARRAGLGTALLRHAAARAAEAGRTTLAADTRDGGAGEAFARALGAQRVITDVRRLLDLTAVPPSVLARIAAEARGSSRGYWVQSWAGTIPEEYFGQVAVINAALNDAPHDASSQGQAWDASRVRAGQRRVEVQGLRYYSVAAQCARSGELAGLTQLGVDPGTPEWGYQEMTAVTRAHRGHRLGLLLKVTMLDLLATHEPQLRWIITGNADENAHMIAINARLGFQFLDRWATWHLDVADVLARPADRAEARLPGIGPGQS